MYCHFSIYCIVIMYFSFFFFFQAEDGIRDYKVTGVQTCALPIYRVTPSSASSRLSAALAAAGVRSRARAVAERLPLSAVRTKISRSCRLFMGIRQALIFKNYLKLSPTRKPFVVLAPTGRRA